jgi:hypothetical protein
MEHREYAPEELRTRLRVFAGGRKAGQGDERPAPGRGAEVEPPVALDEKGMTIFRGENPALKEDGNVDRSCSLYGIGAVLVEALGSSEHSGVNIRETVIESLRERDHSLGCEKYSERTGPDEYARLVEKILKNKGISGATAGAEDGTLLPDRYFGEPVLLGKTIREGVEPLEELLRGLLLEGRVHHLFGGAGKGKTWMALYLAMQLIESGKKVMYLDKENGKRLMAERLESLGVDTERLDSHLLYRDQFSMPATPDAGAAFERLLEEERPELVVFDSWVAFLSEAGLEENDSGDVQKWAKLFALAARRRGVSVLLIDHVPHDTNRSRGSSRKAELMDVQWAIGNKGGFSRGVSGTMYLERIKDREGWLENRVEFTVSATAEDLRIVRRHEDVDPVQSLPAKPRELLLVLDEFPEGVDLVEWREAWKQSHGGGSHSTFYNAKDRLIDPGEGIDPFVEEGPDGKYRKVL